jgi:hypothetical protein
MYGDTFHNLDNVVRFLTSYLYDQDTQSRVTLGFLTFATF